MHAMPQGSRATDEVVQMSALLLRGMLAGILAGFLSFCFATVFTEPLIDRAIALEALSSQAGHHEHGEDGAHSATAPQHEHGTDVGRDTQSGPGLLLGLTVLGAAVGGLFSLVFAFCMGRVGPSDPRVLSMLIALSGFFSLVLVPTLKYPANPPGVGNPETIEGRTLLFFSLLAMSVIAFSAAVHLCKKISKTKDLFSSCMIASVVYVGVMTVVLLALPSYDEAPQNYPANLLWTYRLASVGTQASMWLGLGISFGLWAYRLSTRAAKPMTLKMS